MISRRLRPSFCAAFGVGLGARVVSEPVEHDHVERAVGGSVAAAVQPVPSSLPAAGGDRSGAGQVRERGFRAQAIRVVADGGQQLAGDLDTDTAQG
jgi:hypothetical protein